MLHIGIDATSWLNNRGFGRFTRNLVGALARRNSGLRYTLLFDQAPQGEELPPGVEVAVATTARSLNESAVGTTSRSPGYLWNVARLARKTKFDVFFFPSVYSYFPLLTRVPCVVCYHDTTAERFPKLVFPTALNHRLWQVKTLLARFQTTRAMTISESSANDIHSMFRIPRERIDVITEGADAAFRVLENTPALRTARSRYGIPEDSELLVYLGGLNPHKNLLGLLRAMVQVLSERPGVHVAIVGDTSGKGFWDNVAELKTFVGSHAELDSSIHFTGYMPDPELAELLNTATALIFPSFWEGFGLPAVEAMSCGLPVLASRRASLPEIVGDAGLFYEPEDSSDIARCVLKFLGDPELQTRLRRLALEQSRLFTWDRAAELAEDCFRRCHQDGRR